MTENEVSVFREEFEKLLSTKTGWGRKEVMLVFEKALSAALTKIMIDKVKGESK